MGAEIPSYPLKDPEPLTKRFRLSSITICWLNCMSKVWNPHRFKLQYHFTYRIYFWRGLVRTLQKDAEKYIPHWQWSHLRSDLKTYTYFLTTRVCSITILLYTYCSNLLFLAFILLWSSKLLKYLLEYSSNHYTKKKEILIHQFNKHLPTDAVLKWWKWKDEPHAVFAFGSFQWNWRGKYINSYVYHNNSIWTKGALKSIYIIDKVR